MCQGDILVIMIFNAYFLGGGGGGLHTVLQKIALAQSSGLCSMHEKTIIYQLMNSQFANNFTLL